MSKKIIALIGIVSIMIVVGLAVTLGVEAGTTLFQAVGAILLVIALVLFFTKKENK